MLRQSGAVQRPKQGPVTLGTTRMREELTNHAGGTAVARGTHTGPCLWVALLSRTTLAWLGAIGTKHSWRAAWKGVKKATSEGLWNGSLGPG